MFKKLKSLFIIEEEGSKQEQPKKATAQPSKKAAPTPQSTSKTTTSPVSKPQSGNPPQSGKPDEKFINRLLGALEKNNLDGFDYLEYKQSLQNLANVEMDESTRFKSALAMAQTMGADKNKLVTSAGHYLKVLQTEETKFLQAFKVQQQKQVSSHQDEIKRLEDGIAQREAQIKKMQEEIEKGKKALSQRKNSIDSTQAKVNATKDNFYYAFNIVSKQISDDLNKMKQHL